MHVYVFNPAIHKALATQTLPAKVWTISAGDDVEATLAELLKELLRTSKDFKLEDPKLQILFEEIVRRSFRLLKDLQSAELTDLEGHPALASRRERSGVHRLIGSEDDVSIEDDVVQQFFELAGQTAARLR